MSHGLRQRHVAGIQQNAIEEWIESEPVQKLKNFDIYPKTKELVTESTTGGKILSFLTILIGVILIINEFHIYLTPIRIDTLGVDTQPSGMIDVIFNMTFPHVKCPELHVDVIDAAGEQQIDIFHRVHKTAVDENMNLRGNPVPSALNVAYTPYTDPSSPFFCGSCGDAQTHDGMCCNSCQEVFRQYEITGLGKPRMEDIPQCQAEIGHTMPGCNMYAALRVNKVAGNFHFAPGRSFSQEHETSVHHIHEFNPFLVGKFNSSHIVHQLSFGARHPDFTYPMDGMTEMVHGMAIHKYFIKVVPTAVKGTFAWFGDFESNQFSFTTYIQEIDLKKQLALPGVFFIYDLSPITVRYAYDGVPLLHLIVKLCAVIGGLYTLARGINQIMNTLLNRNK